MMRILVFAENPDDREKVQAATQAKEFQEIGKGEDVEIVLPSTYTETERLLNSKPSPFHSVLIDIPADVRKPDETQDAIPRRSRLAMRAYDSGVEQVQIVEPGTSVETLQRVLRRLCD